MTWWIETYFMLKIMLTAVFFGGVALIIVVSFIRYWLETTRLKKRSDHPNP
jgi:uncharacterized protein involved in exopolysaccharide biosynthesis